MTNHQQKASPIHLGPDYGGRMALGYAVAWAVGPFIVSCLSPSFGVGPFLLIGLYLAWLLWTYGTKAHINVYEDRVEFLCFIREYTIPWTSIMTIQSTPRITFTTTSGKKLQCGIYPNWWQNITFLRRTRFAKRRNTLIAAISENFEAAKEAKTQSTPDFHLRYVLPSRFTQLTFVLVAVLDEVLVALLRSH